MTNKCESICFLLLHFARLESRVRNVPACEAIETESNDNKCIRLTREEAKNALRSFWRRSVDPLTVTVLLKVPDESKSICPHVKAGDGESRKQHRRNMMKLNLMCRQFGFSNARIIFVSYQY